MTSLINKLADWTPNYHKILIFFPTKPLKSLRAARIDEILGSESFARWLVSLALALALVLALVLELALALELELELALALELELELALVLELALDLEHYHITASVNDLTCPLPPHQSVI